MNLSFGTYIAHVCTKMAKNPKVMAVPIIEQVLSFFWRQNPCVFEECYTSLLFLWGGEVISSSLVQKWLKKYSI